MHTHPLRKVAISTTQKNSGCHTATIFGNENVFRQGKKKETAHDQGGLSGHRGKVRTKFGNITKAGYFA